MIKENLTPLKINKLTREQYLAAKEAGTLNEKEFYMTPDVEGKDVANTNTVVWSDISIPVASWVSDSTYSQYPYRATLTFAGCNDTYIPEVFPTPDSIELGVLAPIAVTDTDKIYLYATEKPTAVINIANILLTKNKGSSFVGEEADPDFIASLKADIEALMEVVNTKASYYTYNITLGTTWGTSGSNKVQTVSVDGILSTDSPMIDVICTESNYSTVQDEWAKVFKAESVDGGIKFYASEATTTSLSLQVKLIRSGEGTSALFAWRKYAVESGQ